MPFAFTEQGVAMLSGVINSPKAIEMNIAIMRVPPKAGWKQENYCTAIKRLQNRYNSCLTGLANMMCSLGLFTKRLKT